MFLKTHITKLNIQFSLFELYDLFYKFLITNENMLFESQYYYCPFHRNNSMENLEHLLF